MDVSGVSASSYYQTAPAPREVQAGPDPREEQDSPPTLTEMMEEAQEGSETYIMFLPWEIFAMFFPRCPKKKMKLYSTI